MRSICVRSTSAKKLAPTTCLDSNSTIETLASMNLSVLERVKSWSVIAVLLWIGVGRG